MSYYDCNTTSHIRGGGWGWSNSIKKDICRKGCGLYQPLPLCVKHCPPQQLNQLPSLPEQNTSTLDPFLYIISHHITSHHITSHLTGRSTRAPYFNSTSTHSVSPAALARQRADWPPCSVRSVSMNNICCQCTRTTVSDLINAP